MVFSRDRALETVDREAESLRLVFRSVGVEWDMLSPVLQDRFKKLASETATVGDEQKAVEYAEDLQGVLSAEQLDVVKKATMFTDIGKTGPEGASEAQKDLITRVYAIRENIKGGPGAMTFRQFMEQFYPGSVETDFDVARTMGIDPEETMRTFFNRHAAWTLALLEGSFLPDDVIIGAANHHFLEDVHPGDMIDAEGMIHYRETHRPFGAQEVYVILLDKYDAACTRGGKSHEQAIGWLRNFISKFAASVLAKYPDSIRGMFEEGIAALDRALGPKQTIQEPLQEKRNAAAA